ncbi:reelin domain-containing protein 1-like isoform X2 [Saccoglossus kowalevskii]
MRPGHVDWVPQFQSSGQYFLVVSSYTYSHGTPVTVNVTGPSFGGILIQARPRGDTIPVGHFAQTSDDFHTLSCFNPDDTITHSSATLKNHVSLTWHPPVLDYDDVHFIATICYNHDICWMNIKSSIIRGQPHRDILEVEFSTMTTEYYVTRQEVSTTITGSTDLSTAAITNAYEPIDNRNCGVNSKSYIGIVTFNVIILILVTV